MNLQTISRVVLVDEIMSWVRCFPCIKKLKCLSCKNGLESLTFLETLKWLKPCKFGIRLPASLKKLTLVGCNLLWSDMSLLQLLPKLEVLKLLKYAFVGHRWETGEKPFPQLKFFKLQLSNIRQWKASSINFPCLRRLVLAECEDLEEIPLELGDISTLEVIEIDDSSSSVVESLDRIREEQHNEGNYELELKINVRKNQRPGFKRDFTWKTCIWP
ncbi:hypothetical protein L6452_15935 [Arctium lappa]|uniref:Uncharacterized protein n=1 Tax=Arctium lappa TaxID=4217 RepID=A0ACB9CQ59_ARCLA|nr:hypothetical protein L6452_15935 [Arctium lappa]